MRPGLAMGLGGTEVGSGGQGGAGWVGPLARPNPVDFLFFEIFFSARTNSGNAQKMFRGTKNTPKITKIPGKFIEID
jgi:hypothetical protein